MPGVALGRGPGRSWRQARQRAAPGQLQQHRLTGRSQPPRPGSVACAEAVEQHLLDVSLPSRGRPRWRANGWARLVLPLAGGPVTSTKVTPPRSAAIGPSISTTIAPTSGTRRSMLAFAPSSRATIALGEDFLYELKAGLRAASGRPSARQRHAGHRGTGLTLRPEGAGAVAHPPFGPRPTNQPGAGFEP